MATPFRNSTRPEECGISCFRGQVKNLLISTAYQGGSEKAMGKESEGPGYVLPEFPKISEAKKKEGIFVGLQITQLFDDQDFNRQLDSTKRIVWKAFESVCRNFLGNEKAENYGEIVRELISLYNNTSSRLHFLHSHFYFFPLKIKEPSPMNMAKGSVKIFPRLNGGTLCRTKIHRPDIF